jgi:hypothetical protein
VTTAAHATARGFEPKTPAARPLLLLLVAALWLLIASSIAWKGYVRMVDSCQTDFIGAEEIER